MQHPMMFFARGISLFTHCEYDELVLRLTASGSTGEATSPALPHPVGVGGEVGDRGYPIVEMVFRDMTADWHCNDLPVMAG